MKAYLNKLGQAGQNSLMIGDRKSDFDAALDAGSPFVFCEYGHADPGEIEIYSFKIKSIQELLTLL